MIVPGNRKRWKGCGRMDKTKCMCKRVQRRDKEREM
jgi:hypothetical protein